MGESGEIKVAEIRNISDTSLVFPNGLSFFEPYLQFHTREILDVGGEAYVSRTPQGAVSGLFIYDDSEKTGTVYTRSREVFDYFYELKPFDFLFAEMKTEHESEIYDIYTIDFGDLSIVHRFSHEISVADKTRSDEIERFMVSVHPRMNRRWVSVALRNGDECFVVRLDDEIAGLGWLSMVHGIGRLHSLYVKPQFREVGIGEDILYARLLWLKLKHAGWAFSEISRHNSSSSRIAMRAHMAVSGQVFQYFRKDVDRSKEL
jgi:ribosomal protein S18 acetylase RimI-like enzyme